MTDDVLLLESVMLRRLSGNASADVADDDEHAREPSVLEDLAIVELVVEGAATEPSGQKGRTDLERHEVFHDLFEGQRKALTGCLAARGKEVVPDLDARA